MKLLAKSINHSEGIEESRTLKEHIEDLVYVFENIFSNTEIDEILKSIIKLGCLFHDLGKINHKFQNKIICRNLNQMYEQGRITKEQLEQKVYNLKINNYKTKEISHNLMTGAFINNDFLEKLGLDEISKNILFKISILHHGTFDKYMKESFSNIQESIYTDIYQWLENKDIDTNEIEEYINKELNIDYFEIDRLNLNFDFYDKLNESFSEYELKKDENEIKYKYIISKGYLNLIDHLASLLLEKRNFKYFFDKKELSTIDENLKKFIEEKAEKQGILLKKVQFNKIQKNVQNGLESDLIFTEAFTGGGKTIADDRLICKKKFFLVPNQISAMSFYLDAIQKYGKDNVGILHGDISLYIGQDNSLTNEDVELARNFSKPYIVATIDQIVLSMFKYKNYEKTFASIYESRICLDELHLLSPRMFIVFKYFIQLSVKYFKVKFHLMTATLPKLYYEQIKSMEGLNVYENILSEKDSDIRSIDKSLVKIQYGIENDNNKVISLIKEIIRNKKVNKNGKVVRNRILIVKNTIDSVQKLYKDLKESLVGELAEIKVNCLHSRFKFDDKRNKYIKIIEQEKDEYDIWICTQSVEIALDIDFPYLITDLAPLDNIIQRIGRCNRKDKLDYGEVYILSDNKDVYDKKLKSCASKILKKVNKEILNMSMRKELLKDYYEDKDVNKYYIKEFRKAEEDIRYIYGISVNDKNLTGEKLIFNYEPYMNIVNSKKEAAKLFRSIENSIKIHLEEDWNKYTKGNDNKLLRKSSLNISTYRFRILYKNKYIVKKGNRFILKNPEEEKVIYKYSTEYGLELLLENIKEFEDSEERAFKRKIQ